MSGLKAYVLQSLTFRKLDAYLVITGEVGLRMYDDTDEKALLPYTNYLYRVFSGLIVRCVLVQVCLSENKLKKRNEMK